MKKQLSTALLNRSVVLVLLISGLGIFNTTDIRAQSDANFHSPYNGIHAASLVDVPTALVKITHHLEYLKIFMSQLNQASQEYKNLQESYAFFELIYSLLVEENGTSSSLVAEAIDEALGLMTMDAYGGVSTKKLPELRQTAINVLRI